MTVVNQLKLRFAYTVLIGVLVNVSLAVAGWLLGWFIHSLLAWPFYIWAVFNFVVYVGAMYIKYSKLWNSPYIYLSELERLTRLK